MSSISALETRVENLNEKNKRMRHGIERFVASNVTAASLGALEAAGKLPMAITKRNIPVKPLLSAALFGLGALVSGGFGRACMAAGEAAGNCYSYNAARAKSFVAGEG